MVRKKTIKKIPIVLVFVLFSAFILSLPVVFSNTVSAPYLGEADASEMPNGEDNPIEDEGEDAPPTPTPDPTPTDATESPTETPKKDEFIIIRMGVADIHKGSLILINHAQRYDIPEINDFVTISGAMTASYRVTDEGMLLSASIMDPLNDMMDDFYAETGRDNVAVRSAFRDYANQQEILDYYISIYGQTGALRWASLPGHSEHHAGIALDFGIYTDGVLRAFTNTGVNAWFSQNSWKYGFILRYPDDKTDITGVANEPWHFRYVGLPHAQIIKQNNWCFEEYMEIIMEYSQEEPYVIEHDDLIFEVFYTPDTEIIVPFDSEYEISGNNIDGFIVTLMWYSR